MASGGSVGHFFPTETGLSLEDGVSVGNRRFLPCQDSLGLTALRKRRCVAISESQI